MEAVVAMAQTRQRCSLPSGLQISGDILGFSQDTRTDGRMGAGRRALV